MRGLGERYTSALLDGSRLPSPDPNKRVVPLDLFPSNFLDSISIAKSYSPDLPGDFAGGLVGFNPGTISQSWASGAVTVGSYSTAGGLVGTNSVFDKVSNVVQPIITDSYATAAVSSAGINVTLGGLVGLLPLVLAPGAGSELYRGLGAVILGGMFFSTLVTLVLVPLREVGVRCAVRASMSTS